MGHPRPDPAVETQDPDGLVLVDKEVVRRVEDILACMANAVSAMKLFPSDHATVRNFVDVLAEKFEEFFKTQDRLEVGVDEHTFTYAGRAAYTDETTIKSLPFFFFKDGTRVLYFYRGLDRRELLEFLELVKAVAQKPGGDNDIVAALWESDFSNIQYYAPDEFIENRILAEKRGHPAGQGLPGLPSGQGPPELPSDLGYETLEVKVDLDKLSQGRIELTPEDRERLRWRPGAEESAPVETPVKAEDRPGPAPSPEGSGGLAPSPVATADPNLSEAEVRQLDEMIHANRILWPEEEFVKIAAEVVWLENDLTICAASLDALLDFELEQLRQGQFPAASMIIGKMRDLKSRVEPNSPGKAALLESCLERLAGPKPLEAVAAHLAEKGAADWPALLDFFSLLGPAALPLSAGFFEGRKDPEVRALILSFIERTGADDPGLIAALANDSRPALSREVIRILMNLPGQKGTAHLAAFLRFKDPGLKLEVIHALGGLRDDMSNKILMGFLNDPDEEIRIQAAMKLDPTEERSRIAHVLREASDPAFLRKSLKEKRAILSFLGRTRSAEALAFLTSALARTTLFPSARNTEMRLAAVAGLESMGTPEAREALEAGAKRRGRQVREACGEALARTAPGPAGKA